MEKSTAFKDGGIAYKGAVKDTFDVIIVGSGPGGYLAAEELGKSGQKVLIVEKEFWGGVCLNIGCIPTKAMLASGEEIQNILKAESYGVVGNLDQIKIDYDKSWLKINERKSAVVRQISGSVKMLMKGSRCSIIEGEAKFVGSHEISVNGEVYRGKNIIMAMGSHSRRLTQLPGFEQGYKDWTVLSSREAITYDGKARPKSVTIVGGGVIGVEFAQVYSSMNTKVTIIQNIDRLLPGVDIDIVREVIKQLQAKGIEIIYNANTLGLNSKKELEYEAEGKKQSIKSDFYLVSVGRIPSSQGLEKTGVKLGKRGEVIVDSKMRTNVKNVYAIGDLVGQAMLAHVAYGHALTAVAQILKEKGVEYKANRVVPGCIYTHPEIAFVGLTEEKARELGYDVFSAKYMFGYLGKAIAAVQTPGFVKLVVNKKDGKILGAHMIGANTTDYIAELTMVIDKGFTVYDVTYTIHPHPTFSEIVWEAARAAVLKLNNEKKLAKK